MENAIKLGPVILIVDDNPANLQVLGKLLKESKYEVEFAVDGESAFEWLTSKQFDLVLLDINMPGMNGFDVCRKIRSNNDLKHLPVIFLSADNDRESILKGFEMGGQDYVTKPFDSRELIVRVKTQLALKQSLEKLEKLNQSLEEKVRERTQQLSDSNKKLEETNLKLLELDKAKTEFLQLISHEIRTPLNGIIGPVQLLKEQSSADTFKKMIEILDLSVKRLEKFALNALLITQLKTKNVISKSRIQPKILLNETLQEIEEKLKAKNLHIQLLSEHEDISFFGDFELLKKCFLNILDNAIRYSPNDEFIEVHCFFEDENFICEIRDHGSGFSQQILDSSFEPFITDKKYSDNQIGLDLPIIKMIMDAHEGNACLFNHPSGGAVVKLEFKSLK